MRWIARGLAVWLPITVGVAVGIGLHAQAPTSRTGAVSAAASGLRGSFLAPSPRFPNPDRVRQLAAAFPGIDERMRAFATSEHLPGAAWAVVIDGTLAHAGVHGLRDVEAGAAVTRDSVFRIASMTKSFTAMAILQLRDEGRLSLDDPAERYVPELAGLRYPTADAPKITVRHLLSHATGFPEDNPWGDQQLSQDEAAFTAMLRAGLPFSTAPGTAYEYSNYGFAILGRIVTTVSGRPYRDYIRERILEPLGMRATTLEPAEVPADRLVQGYRWEDNRWRREPLLPDGAFGSMGGMLTSLDDLARYVGVFLQAWPARDGDDPGPVRRASLREMQQAWRARPTVVTRSADGTLQLAAGAYGFGLRVTETCQFGHVVAHTGGLPGFGSIMRWLPEYGVGIIAFGSRTYTGWDRVTDEALAMLAETGALQPREVQPSPALVEARDVVSRLITQWDDREADRIAAVNLFLDRSRDRRKAELEALRAQVGACAPPTGFDHVENALRGTWTLACERGRVRASVTLAPTMPLTVQYLEASRVEASTPPARLPACR